MGQQRYSGGVVACRLQDAPFVDERNRYLRHCAANGARPSGLKVKRYELRWIARHLGPDAHFGVGMTELMQIALERQHLRGAATAARRVIDIGRPWLRFLGWWREPAVPFLYRDHLDHYVTWMRDERGFTPATVEQWSRTTKRFLLWCAGAGRELAESDGRRHRQLCRHPGNGPLGARLDSQRDLGLVRVPALRCPGGVVLEPIGRIDFPASALSAGVFAICPGLVCRSADAGRRRHGQATGYP